MHADHFIWSTYGNWMPNCPRESWPRYIHSWERSRAGLRLVADADTTDRAEGQQDPYSFNQTDPYRVNRLAAEKTRRYPPVSFTPLQAQVIAEGFERCVRIRHAWVWACCIMPEYVQMIVTCPRTSASLLSGSMRGEATKRLTELSLHPMSEYITVDGQTPLMWSHTKWHQQLKDDRSIHEAIEYVQNLPQHEGSPGQHWSFIREFQGLDRCREESEAYEFEAAAG